MVRIPTTKLDLDQEILVWTVAYALCLIGCSAGLSDNDDSEMNNARTVDESAAAIADLALKRVKARWRNFT